MLGRVRSSVVDGVYLLVDVVGLASGFFGGGGWIFATYVGGIDNMAYAHC